MSRRVEWLLLGLILLLAGALRMGRPDLTEFKRDEAALYRLALDVAEFKAFPVRGIGSSVGVPNTPISVYLFALPLFLWKSPLAATLFVGALNTASVALAYALARRYWGVRPALLSALLYAAAPWAVLYSRKLWAQDLLPLFVVGHVFTALLTFVEGRRRWLIPHLALLALAVQIHYAGAVLAPLTGLLLMVYWRRVDWRLMGWGALAAALLAAPFAWYLVTELLDQASLTALLELTGRPAVYSADSVWLATLVALGLEAHSPAGPAAFRDFLATVPDFTPLLMAGGGVLAAGAGLVLWRARPGAPRSVADQAGLVLAAWLVLPVLFFLRHATPIYPHYFILFFPAPYLLAGLALDAGLTRWPSGWARGLGWAFPAALAGAQTWLVVALLGFLGARATPGGFGVPLGILLAVAEQAQGAPDVLVLSAGADPGLDEIPAVFDVLLRDTAHRFVEARTTAVFPAGPALVIVWPAAEPYPGAARYPADVTIPLRAGEGAVHITRWTGRPPAVPRPRAASALLANGVEVLGSGGAAAQWELWWQAPAGGPGENMTVFAHLLDAAGGRVAQADLPTYPAAGWRAGDVVVSYFPLAGSGVAVRAGMYGTQSLTPVDVLDVNGNPAGQWLEFPLAVEP